MRIDLNCDLGEGAAFDAELMPLITSANVCCGAHAGGAVRRPGRADGAERRRQTVVARHVRTRENA